MQTTETGAALPANLLAAQADLVRVDVTRQLDPSRQSELGQFLTPAPTATFMASLFSDKQGAVRLLEAGAGVGSLIAAFVAEMCRRSVRPSSLSVTAYEIDPLLVEGLETTLSTCRLACEGAGIQFGAEVRQEDFIAAAASRLGGDLFSEREQREQYTCAILNPPYRKIHSSSTERALLSSAGIETGNLYTGFVALAAQLLEADGELVAITPRSFCNGPYFRSFRQNFLESMRLRRIHVYESRSRAFKGDSVLQENIIFRAVKGGDENDIEISSNGGPADDAITTRMVPHGDVVDRDKNRFIHIVPDELGGAVARRVRSFKATLADLGIGVSTGRVVDFRAKEWLRSEPGPGTAPLIYPGHLRNGDVAWPRQSKKPNALVDCSKTEKMLLPPGVYVLVKRFSSKEERRRVVATVYEPSSERAGPVAFENHLNVYHDNDAGLTADFARGLAAFLNSSLVDLYFRQFNGHTQVNATDLRSLKYPPIEDLERLGSQIPERQLTQGEIDALVEREVVDVAGPNPVKAIARIQEALGVLKELELPRAQQNERSALTLLALLGMPPETPWIDATDPLRGVTEMMEFFSEHYGKTYAPNTRETVRRQTIHQFEQAGLIVRNPDKPDRAVNSPKTVYQISPAALDVLRVVGTKGYRKALTKFHGNVRSLKKQYAYKRKMARIPVRVGDDGDTLTLSPGGQNDLIKQIVEEFCARFTPGGTVLYVGDADDKWVLNEKEAFAKLGLTFDEHGKMPDVVVYYEAKKWLVLVEAVTSHGPMDPKRHDELKKLFKGSIAGLVFVTAFEDRRILNRFLKDIAWETEVWVADAPGHLIHFDGERFLGPYPTQE